MWRHIIESHSTSYIRCFARLTFYRIFHISVFDYTDCPCFEVKDEEDLLLEKTVRGYKTGRGKGQSKLLWNSWERRMTPAPDYFMLPTGKRNYIKTIQLQNTYKKGTALFSTNHKKTGNNLNYFYQGFDDLLSSFIEKLSVCRIL